MDWRDPAMMTDAEVVERAAYIGWGNVQDPAGARKLISVIDRKPSALMSCEECLREIAEDAYTPYVRPADDDPAAWHVGARVSWGLSKIGSIGQDGPTLTAAARAALDELRRKRAYYRDKERLMKQVKGAGRRVT